MADTDTWMPLYIADYLSATQRLTCEQHGAYMLLIMDYWRNGAPPDDDEVLTQIVRLERARWRKHRPVLAKLFQIEGGEWHHKRIDAELERARGIVSKRSEAGKAGAAKRWQSHDKGNGKAIANASQTHWQNDAPSPPPSPTTEEEREDSQETTPLPHGALAFSGRVIRLNRRDFEQWQRTYHGIADIQAELTALDDWLRDNPDPTLAKRWFHVVSSALAKKHQAALRTGRDGERSAVPIV